MDELSNEIEILHIDDGHEEVQVPGPFQRASTAITNWDAYKTLAIIPAVARLGAQVAVSGWLTRNHNTGYPKMLPQAKCLAVTFALMRMVDQELVRDSRDQGYEGRYHACHAERQAISNTWYNTDLQDTITILISKEPCADCWKFLAAVELRIGVEVNVVVKGEKLMEQRSRSLLQEWLSCWKYYTLHQEDGTQIEYC